MGTALIVIWMLIVLPIAIYIAGFAGAAALGGLFNRLANAGAADESGGAGEESTGTEGKEGGPDAG